MLRSELVSTIADEYDLRRQDAEIVVNVIFGTITDALTEGRFVELRGFGTFSTTIYAEKIGFHPVTGKDLHMPERRILKFKPGRTLRRRVNN